MKKFSCARLMPGTKAYTLGGNEMRFTGETMKSSRLTAYRWDVMDDRFVDYFWYGDDGRFIGRETEPDYPLHLDVDRFLRERRETHMFDAHDVFSEWK